MRIIVFLSVTFAMLGVSFAARAWDGVGYWFDPAQGALATPYNVSPGAGGILATGGAMDHNVTCANCHTKGATGYGSIDVTFSPPFGATYAPGQTYQIMATMVGEHLGLSGCSQYVTGNVNEIGAAFENDSGQPVGVLKGDYGDSSSCPSGPPPQGFMGKTVVYGDCHALLAAPVPDTTSWTFSWTAPAAGTGTVTLYYGAVDGNCMMDSLNDDVKFGTVKLGEGMAPLTPPRKESDGGKARALALFGLLPAFAAVLAVRRRRSRPALL